MGHQVTSLLRLLGVGGRLPPPWTPPAPLATVPDGPLAVVVERARRGAGTRADDAEEAVRELWDGLPRRGRDGVHDPVRTLARAGRQTDGTTCGSAVLTMLAAAGDPFLAGWLAAGVVPPTAFWPVELSGAPSDRLAALAAGPAERRFAVLQRVLKHRTNARAVLGTLTWPHALGTPPWGAAAVARFPGATYRAVVVDDTHRPLLDATLDRVGAAVAAGVPVPLYSGGDSSTGWVTALPRHVVLAVGGGPERLEVWEPARGRVHDLDRANLVHPEGPRAALGGWSHLAWALLPSA